MSRACLGNRIVRSDRDNFVGRAGASSSLMRLLTARAFTTASNVKCVDTQKLVTHVFTAILDTPTSSGFVLLIPALLAVFCLCRICARTHLHCPLMRWRKKSTLRRRRNAPAKILLCSQIRSLSCASSRVVATLCVLLIFPVCIFIPSVHTAFVVRGFSD